MSKLFAIQAKEKFYDGLYGIKSNFVVECEEEEAREIAEEASLSLIDSCDVLEALGWKEKALLKGYQPNSDDYHDYVLKCRMADAAYEISEITEETTGSLEWLNEKIKNDYEGFVKKYCNKNS